MSDALSRTKSFLATWTAPAVFIGLFGLFLTVQNFWLSSRFGTVEDRATRLEKSVQDLNTRVDQRFDKLSETAQTQTNQITGRIDKLLDAQTALAVQISKTDSSVTELSAKVDKISQKLHVASADEFWGAGNAAGADAASMVSALRSKGFNIVELKDVPNKPPVKAALAKQIVDGGKWFAFTPDNGEWDKAVQIMGNDPTPAPTPEVH
jgi:hypothetical protein